MSRAGAVRVAITGVLAAAGALLASCGTPPAASADAPVAIEADNFGKVITLVGPASVIRNDQSHVGGTYMLRSFVAKGARHDVLHQLYVEFDYADDTEHYQFATDDAARRLKLRHILYVGCGREAACVKKEMVGIEVPDAVLRRRVVAGYRVEVRSRAGDSEILTLTPRMIGKQLGVVDEIIDGGTPTPLPRPPLLGISWVAASAHPFDGAPRGLIAVAVGAGTPAAADGVKPGDVLEVVDGRPIRVYSDLVKALAARAPGATAKLVLAHGRTAPIAAGQP